MKHILVCCLVAMLAVACQNIPQAPREPTVFYTLGEELTDETFDSDDSWNTWSYEDIDLRVWEGTFRITAGDQGYVWAINNQIHTDVVIDVTARQLSTHTNNGYGVMCRAQDNGDGYYFLISGDGYYSIRRGAGNEVQPVVEWEATNAIHQGTSANDIRAVCIDRYLALYINGLFVVETEDNAIFQGYTGFTAAASDNGDVDVTFDNLTINEASIEDDGS
jgi:hypothetical protein